MKRLFILASIFLHWSAAAATETLLINPRAQGVLRATNAIVNLANSTNLPGSGLQSASVNSNRFDAATLALLGGGGGATDTNAILRNNGFGTNTTFYGINLASNLVTFDNLIGGSSHTFVSGANSVVLGVGHTLAGGPANTMSGGATNLISSVAEYCTIAGGVRNIIGPASIWSVVGGGMDNNMTFGDGSVIAGGRDNTMNGSYSFIFGRSNTASAGVGLGPVFAVGARVTITNARTFAWGDDSAAFRSKTNNTFIIQALNGVGINTNYPGTNALKVRGNVDAGGFSINGVPLSGGVTYLAGEGLEAVTNSPANSVTFNAAGQFGNSAVNELVASHGTVSNATFGEYMEVGVKFVVSTNNMFVTELGRWNLLSNSLPRVLKLLDSNTNIVGTVTVFPATSPTNEFAWAQLPSPVQLLAGQTYNLLSMEVTNYPGSSPATKEPVAVFTNITRGPGFSSMIAGEAGVPGTNDPPALITATGDSSTNIYGVNMRYHMGDFVTSSTMQVSNLVVSDSAIIKGLRSLSWRVARTGTDAGLPLSTTTTNEIGFTHPGIIDVTSITGNWKLGGLHQFETADHAGTPDGQTVIFVNSTGFQITFVHNAATVSAGSSKRFNTYTGLDIVRTNCTATFYFDSVTDRWRLISIYP